MILKELLKLLNKIRKVHPEAGDADVIAQDNNPQEPQYPVHIGFVRYDKRHKPARIILED